MVNEIKSVIVESTENLNLLITNYLQTKSKASFATFQQKLEKFGEFKRVSNLDKAKFKVYAKINKDLCNDHNSESVCKMSLNFYYPFIINLYAKDEFQLDNNAKFITAIHNFVSDMQAVIQGYLDNTMDYAQYPSKVS